MAQQYTSDFYIKRQQKTQLSANIVLSLLFSKIQPNTVIDFGCATGIWLAECKNQGAICIDGLDGRWVDQKLLEIGVDEFTVHDFGLTKYIPKRKYDLALCIEVAEHLSPEMGRMLVESITQSSEVVLFSAAVSGQGGTGHINEQPQHYWAKQFAEQDYICIDLIRPNVWGDEAVNVIYKQNMLLFVRKTIYKELKLDADVISKSFDLDRIHPDLLRMRTEDRVVGRRTNIKKGLKLLIKGFGVK